MGYAPIGKPLMSVICYQLDNILIDTGAKNVRQSLVKLMNPASVDKILLTHYHEDHAGNAAFLNEQFNLPVFAHPLTCQALQTRITLKPYEYFMWGGLTPLAAKPLAATVDTEKHQFSIHHTPGHSPDHVVYLEPNQGWLFSGDMFLGARIKYFRRDENIRQTIQSLKTMLALNFDRLFCGHNPQLKNPHKSLQRKLDYLEDIYGEVSELVKQGCNERTILKQLLANKEDWPAKIFTLGDVSYKNLLTSAIKNYRA